MDYDVHFGDGTQDIVDHDASILFISIHRYDHGDYYPGSPKADCVNMGKAEGMTINVPWNTVRTKEWNVQE